MLRNKILMSLATVAIVAGAPALADPGGGHGGGHGGGPKGEGAGPAGGMGDMMRADPMRDMDRMDKIKSLDNANPRALERANENSVLKRGTDTTTGPTNRRVNSQGALHASPRALERASPNSALATAGVTTLTGLATGLTVNNSGGTAVGTVDSIVTNRSGAVVGINVDLTAGGTVFIPATTLSIDGTTVVTSSTQF